MGRLFNYDNGIMQTLSKIFDCICANFLWLLCCIPIFTIGASSAAYYYAYNKAIRQKRSYACKEFFRGLKENRDTSGDHPGSYDIDHDVGNLFVPIYGTI